MALYFVRSILCMAVLLLVYLFFLEKEKMHRFNRWYLLVSILFSCMVPLISLKTSAIPVMNVLPDDTLLIIAGNPDVPQTTITQINETGGNSVDVFTLLLVVYALITTGLLIRFFRNIYLLISRTAKNKVIDYKGAKLVLVKESIVSHSFLHYIFVNRDEYENKKVEKEIFTHELTHVNEKHSWDILFVELLQTIYWFNPLFPFYKKAIQLNHEFLADNAVITKHEDVHAYQFLLLEKASITNTFSLSSSFNYSITKKRLVMMTKNTTQAMALLKKLLVLPLLAATFILFSSKVVLAQSKTKPEQKSKPASADGPPVLQQKRITSTKEGVSPQVWEEYNTIISEYLFTDSKGHERIHSDDIAPAKRSRMETIFNQMSPAQQHDAKVGFMNPIKPPSKSVPTETQLEKWKDPANYGVWIDGKKVLNETLNKYKPSDFSYYSASNLAYNDAARKNIMERYNLKVMYKVQLNLETNASFDKWLEESKKPQEFIMYYQYRAAPKTNGKPVAVNMPI